MGKTFLGYSLTPTDTAKYLGHPAAPTPRRSQPSKMAGYYPETKTKTQEDTKMSIISRKIVQAALAIVILAIVAGVTNALVSTFAMLPTFNKVAVFMVVGAYLAHKYRHHGTYAKKLPKIF